MTEYMRVPREPTEAMLANGREALLPLVRLDSYGPLIGLWRDMLAASPQGEGSSAAPIPTEQLEGAVVGADEPIGDDGQFAYRTTLMGERHIVHVATGFVWFKLPYDYRYTDNASQRRNAETMLAALLGRPTHPAPIKTSADTGELRERAHELANRLHKGCLYMRDSNTNCVVDAYKTDKLLTEAANAILDLIQSERAGSPIGQNDKPDLAFSDAGEP